MGQKVHPVSFRLGVVKTWGSRWYAGKKDFAKFLHEDIKVRKHVLKTFNQAAIAKVEIEHVSKLAGGREGTASLAFYFLKRSKYSFALG